MRRELHVRFCEGGGVRFPSATRRVITCKSAAEARAAMDVARRILKQLGVELHPQKTRIVHVRYGFEFLGYKIKSGWRRLHLPGDKIRSQVRQGALYGYPKEKSIHRFMDEVRQRTKRTVPLRTKELIEELNPLLRGWGEYYKRAHVRKTLPTSRRLDPAANMVAPVPTLAQRRLETAACDQAVRRVRACAVDLFNSLSCTLGL